MSSTDGLEPLPNGFYRARFRTGAGRVRMVLHVTDRTVALERRNRLQAMISSLVKAKLYSAASSLLEDGAKATTGREFAAVERAARVTLQEAAVEPLAQPKPTYRDVAEDWLDGTLHEQEPTISKRCKNSVDCIRGMFEKYVYPIIGKLPVDEIDGKHLDKVRKSFAKLGGRSIGMYARTTLHVLSIAHYPLQLRGPIPVDRRQFTKSVTPPHEFGWLYPSEECRVVSNPDEPLGYRACFGFMTRNGTRPGETTKLVWSNINLAEKHIVVPARITKTKKRRAWTLDDDVVAALEAYRKSTGASDEDRVFPFTVRAVRDWLRAALRRCGVNRDELLVSDEYQRRLRLHDGRATFCTVGVNTGRSDRWLRERTGHVSAKEFERYVRQATSAPEREHGWFAPLDQCLAGKVRALQVGQRLGQGPKKAGKSADPSISCCSDLGSKTDVEPPNSSRKTRGRSGSKDASQSFGPPQIDLVGQLAEQAKTIRQLTKALTALQAQLAKAQRQRGRAR